MAIVTSTHVLLTGALMPAVPSVVRVTEPSPVSGMEEVAQTTVVPVVAEFMSTVQSAAAPPHVLSLLDALPILPGPLVILAVAVPLPNVVFTELTVMVSVWLVPTALTAVAGVIWMFASTFVFVYVQVTVSPSPSELTVATPVPRSVVIVEVSNAEVQVSEDSLNWLGIGVSVKARLPPSVPGAKPLNVWLAVPLTVVRLKVSTDFPVAG